MTMPELEISQDAFLDGRLTICQPKTGYRAGVDPVLLAAFVAAKSGQSVLELGCGVGTASFCLATRVQGLRLTGLELQADYAALAVENAAANKITFDVHVGDLTRMPADLRGQSFDHVIANPPYYDRRRGTSAPDAGRETALGETVDLRQWMDAAIKRLKPKGQLAIVQDILRLPDVLGAFDDRVGGVLVQPIAPRMNAHANRVLVRAIKGSNADFTLNAPIIMHEGQKHTEDRESYTPMIRGVLRGGQALILPTK
ncbi:MAG: tRNA1(Val) (adenine(37)-N6)-methyltransferase [Halocynthiibacter sp.]